MGNVKQMYIDEVESSIPSSDADDSTSYERTDWEWEQEKAEIDQGYAEWLRDHSNERDSF